MPLQDPKKIYTYLSDNILDWGATLRRFKRHPLDESSVQMSYADLELEMKNDISPIYKGQIVSILDDDAPYYVNNDTDSSTTYHADRIFTNSYFNYVESAYYVNRYQLGTYYSGVGEWPMLEYEQGTNIVSKNSYAEIFNDYVNNRTAAPYSHIEGGSNSAASNATYSHVQGLANTSSNIANFTSGYNNANNSAYSIISGTHNTASGQSNLTIGSDNVNNAYYAIVNGIGNVAHASDKNSIVSGNANLSYGPNSQVAGSDNINRGENSNVIGTTNKNEGNNNYVNGSSNTSSPDTNNSLIIGNENTVDGENGITAGYNNTNEGENTSIIGSDNIASSSSKNSDISGEHNINHGNDNIISGNTNTINNNVSNVISSGTHNVSNYGSDNSIINGSDNELFANNSIVTGLGNEANGSQVIVGGNANVTSDKTTNTIVVGAHNDDSTSNSVVAGGYGENKGNNSIVGGWYNVNLGNNSGTLGTYVTNRGNNSSVIGEKTDNSSSNTFAGGDSNIVAMGANNSIVGGTSNIVQNPNSLVVGSNNYSYNADSIIGGFYSDTDAETLFALGNGTEGQKSNAFEVKENGTTYINGDGYTYTWITDENGNMTAVPSLIINHSYLATYTVSFDQLGTYTYGVGKWWFNGTTYSNRIGKYGEIFNDYTYNRSSGDFTHAEGYHTYAIGGVGSHSEGQFTLAAGNTSHAEGQYTTAIGEGSHTEGVRTGADGFASHAEGAFAYTIAFGGHAEGTYTYAFAHSSHAEGYGSYASGKYSHAEGNLSYAIGQSSHTEGFQTSAYENYGHAEGNHSISRTVGAHAEGYNTYASGQYSHTEGGNTYSTGIYSHAEGNTTYALGQSSHAEGNNSYAVGVSAHAESNKTTAFGPYSHAEGNMTYANGTGTHTEGYESIAYGNYSHSEGVHTYTSKEAVAAHTEGTYTMAYADSAHAEGKATYAEGAYSHSEGFWTVAGAQGSHTEGMLNFANSLATASHVEGAGNSAYAAYTHAEGFQNLVNMQYSHVEGLKSVSGGNTSHAEGERAVTYGDVSHVEGFRTYINHDGDYSHAEGMGTSVFQRGSHAEGGLTMVHAAYAHAEGFSTSVSETGATGAHAEGIGTIVERAAGHAEGAYNFVSAEFGHAEGVNTFVATGAFAGHTEGALTQALSSYTHAEGFNTHATGSYSHTEGFSTQTDKVASHAEGWQTAALGSYSHASGYRTVTGTNTYAAATFGYRTQAYMPYEVAFGRFNRSYTSGTDQLYRTKYTHEYINGAYVSNGVWPEGDEVGGGGTIFTIGDGIGDKPEGIDPDSYRHNIIEVHRDGAMVKNGVSYFNNDVFGPVSYTYVESLGISAYLTTVLSALLENPKYTRPTVCSQMSVTDTNNSSSQGKSSISFRTGSASVTMEIGTYFVPRIQFRATYVAPNYKDWDQIYTRTLSNRLGYSEGVTSISYYVNPGGLSAGLNATQLVTYVPQNSTVTYTSLYSNHSEEVTCYGLTYKGLKKSCVDDTGIFAGGIFSYTTVQSFKAPATDSYAFCNSTIMNMPRILIGDEQTYQVFRLYSYDYMGSTQMYFQQLAEKMTYVTNNGLDPTTKFPTGSYVSANLTTFTVKGSFYYYYGKSTNRTFPTSSFNVTSGTKAEITCRDVNATQTHNMSVSDGTKYVWFAIPEDLCTIDKYKSGNTGYWWYKNIMNVEGALDTTQDSAMGGICLSSVVTSTTVGVTGHKYRIYYVWPVASNGSINAGTVYWKFKRTNKSKPMTNTIAAGSSTGVGAI